MSEIYDLKIKGWGKWRVESVKLKEFRYERWHLSVVLEGKIPEGMGVFDSLESATDAVLGGTVTHPSWGPNQIQILNRGEARWEKVAEEKRGAKSQPPPKDHPPRS